MRTEYSPRVLLILPLAAPKDSLRIKPEFAFALHDLGTGREVLGKHEDAAGAFRRLLRVEPRHPNGNYERVSPTCSSATASAHSSSMTCCAT